MIHSSSLITPVQVARHYDELDVFYREVWGQHVHHGWFVTGRESKEEATLNLTCEVGRLLDPNPGDRICDIGCGYGATSKYLAARYYACVTGVTLSQAQARYAKSSSEEQNVDIRVMDFLQNDFANESFDRLLAIESSEHMPDKARFFSEAHRILKPGGRFVIAAWLTREKPTPFEQKHLLEPICREGRLPSMGSESDFREWLSQQGFQIESVLDISQAVKRTWTLTLTGLMKHVLQHPKNARLLLSRFNSNAEFLKTLFRIRWAYETGAMRYLLFTSVKI